MGVFIYKKPHILNAVYNIICKNNDGKLYKAKVISIGCKELKVSTTVIQKALGRLYTTGYIDYIYIDGKTSYIKPNY